MPDVSLGLSAKAACSNGGTIRPRPNVPRSPGGLRSFAPPSSEYSRTASSKLVPFLIFARASSARVFASSLVRVIPGGTRAESLCITSRCCAPICSEPAGPDIAGRTFGGSPGFAAACVVELVSPSVAFSDLTPTFLNAPK